MSLCTAILTQLKAMCTVPRVPEMEATRCLHGGLLFHSLRVITSHPRSIGEQPHPRDMLSCRRAGATVESPVNIFIRLAGERKPVARLGGKVDPSRYCYFCNQKYGTLTFSDNR